MNLATALKLGRVSNLPTVWTNVLAGFVLAGGDPQIVPVAVLAIAASALYVGGMFLNDAFDAEVDARERPERPIPAGEVQRAAVLAWGFGWLAAGVALTGVASVVAGGSMAGVVAAATTAALIVVYDLYHKGNPLGPAIMGLCRVGVYMIAALTVTTALPPRVFYGCGLLLAFVLGLTYAAKFEGKSGLARSWPLAGLWAPLAWAFPLVRGAILVRLLLAGYALWISQSVDLIKKGGEHIRKAVGQLIAGIALVDGLIIAREGHVELALVAFGAFLLTLALQRRVVGT